MSLNNLRNYNWEQGTLSNPVSLTGTQFSWLINLLKKGTVNKDIRGYIQVGSPITSYEKYLVELAKDEHNQPLLHLVNPTITPVEYSVVPQASTIKEGNSTKLNVNGIGLEALKFRIVNHTNDTPDYQARTTIDTKSGYVIVAPARENTTWTDVVTIQTCPVWEEWDAQDASIVEFNVTVNAVAVTSVTITAPQYVKPGVTFYPIIDFKPAGHTKPIVNTLKDAAAKKGICFDPTSDKFTVGKTTDPTKMSAIAPDEETSAEETWSLGCGVYAFTDAQTIATPSVNVIVKYPYIQFTVTTDGKFSDISSANPKITLQKVDSQDSPIGEPIELTGTAGDSSLVYTYGGGSVAGDGSETYQVTFGTAPEGYRNIQQMTIIPNQVVTEIAVQYIFKRPDMYVVYTDGSYETLSQVENNGRLSQNVTNAVGIGIVTEDTSFMIAVRDDEVIFNSEIKLIGSNSSCPITVGNVSRTYSSSNAIAFTDFDGEKNTIVIANYFTEHPELIDDDNSCIPFVREKSVTYGNRTYYGFVPALGQLGLINSNNTILNSFIRTYWGITNYIPWRYDGIWSSTGQNNTNDYWTANISYSPQGTKATQSSKRPFVPCYEFNID